MVGAVVGRTGFMMIGGIRNMEMQPGNPRPQVSQAKDQYRQLSDAHCWIIAQPEATCPCPAVRFAMRLAERVRARST